MSERTCKNCSERYLAPKCNRFGCVDCDEYDMPDDDGRTFADLCIYWKQGDPDTLEQRYAKLEAATKKLYSLCLALHKHIGRNDSFALRIIEADLIDLGVSLDD